MIVASKKFVYVYIALCCSLTAGLGSGLHVWSSCCLSSLLKNLGFTSTLVLDYVQPFYDLFCSYVLLSINVFLAQEVALPHSCSLLKLHWFSLPYFTGLTLPRLLLTVAQPCFLAQAPALAHDTDTPPLNLNRCHIWFIDKYFYLLISASVIVFFVSSL